MAGTIEPNKLKMAGAASLQRDRGPNGLDREHNNSEIGVYPRKPIIGETFEWAKNGTNLDK